MSNRVVVCSVFDSAVQAFQRPFFVPSIGAAIRSFTDEVNRDHAENLLNKHPQDFCLHYLCDFMEDSGQFSTDAEGSRVLIRGQDAVRKE